MRTRTRPDSPNPIRRAAAMLVALTLGAGLAVVGTAAPASAHHNTITGKVVCATDGSASIEWTVTNSESDKDETITASSNTTLVPVGTQIAKGASATFTQHDAAAGTVKLQLSAKWTKNGQTTATNTDSGTVTVVAGQCDDAPTVKKITFCHATGSATNPYVRITTSVNAFFTAGHDDHQDKGDIYPAFSYEKHGKTFEVAAQGDQSLLQYADCLKPFDWNWEYAAPTCKALTVVYPANLPAGQANDVNVRVIADGKELTLNFHKGSGTWSGTQVFTFADHQKWTDPGIWSIVWVQVGGTNYHWQGSIECGDAVTVCHWDATTNGYDKETIAVKRFFADKHATHAKDIYPSFTYTDWWLFVPITKTQPAKGDQSLLQYPDCAKPPVEVPAPAAPAFTDACGPDNEVFTEPVDTEQLDWTTTYAASSITVKLAAKPGFALPVGAQTEWTYPIDDAPCSIELDAVPTFSDVCGAGNESLTIPESTDRVLWTSSEHDGVITVTATARGGFVFPVGTKTSWEFVLNDAPCVIGLDAVPTFSDVCGAGNESLTVPESTDQVLWASTEKDGVITVTATAKPGFAFPADTKASWEFVVNDEPCIIELVGSPTFSDVCGAGNESLTVPESTDQVLWASTEKDGVITVTATAKPGFAFPADTKASWEFVLNDEPCIIELVGSPTFDDECGPDNHELVVPESTDTVEWSSVEENGVITVTATAKGDAEFSDETQATWVYTIDDSDCLIPLEGEPTFSDVCGADNEKVGLPADTETVTWSQRESEGSVIVTATPQPGYAFESDVTFEWTFALNDADCIEPSLTGSFATGQCLADAPWIFYSVALADPDQQATSNTAWLVLTDGTNTERIELGELTDGVLSGQQLWPGASVADDGVTPTGWPGWEQLADGTWQETDGNFAWTRDITSATIEVNPSLTIDLSYPEATPDCANGPSTGGHGGGDGDGGDGGDGGTGGGGDTVTAEADGSGLANTGFAGTSIAIVAGLIVLAGAAFLVIARVRRKRA